MNKVIISKENYKLIMNKDYEAENISAFCSVCSHIIRTHSDEASMRKFNCCFQCSVEFAYPNKEKWDNGWRPEKELVDQSITKRPKIMINLNLGDI
jgi:hypothetical protein